MMFLCSRATRVAHFLASLLRLCSSVVPVSDSSCRLCGTHRHTGGQISAFFWHTWTFVQAKGHTRSISRSYTMFKICFCTEPEQMTTRTMRIHHGEHAGMKHTDKTIMKTLWISVTSGLGACLKALNARYYPSFPISPDCLPSCPQIYLFPWTGQSARLS